VRTDKGRNAVESTYLAHLGLETNWFSPLTDAERLVLFMLLEKMLPGEEAERRTTGGNARGAAPGQGCGSTPGVLAVLHASRA
jgi:hypothetical protein